MLTDKEVKTKFLSHEEAINYILGLFRKYIPEEEIREEIGKIKKEQISLREVTLISKFLLRKIPRDEKGNLIEIDYYERFKANNPTRKPKNPKYNTDYSYNVINRNKIEEAEERIKKQTEERNRLRSALGYNNLGENSNIELIEDDELEIE